MPRCLPIAAELDWLEYVETLTISFRAVATGERTAEGYFGVRGGIDAAIARGLAYAPYADMVWFETSEPSMEEAKK